MELEGKSALVVGLARSGIAAARFLAGRGAHVVATDRKPASDLPEEALSLARQGVVLELGSHPAAGLHGRLHGRRVPGRALGHAGARGGASRRRARDGRAGAGLPEPRGDRGGGDGHQGEVHDHGGARRDAPRGRDRRARRRQHRRAPHRPARGRHAATVFAVEASSFQLEGIETFRPKVAVFLNLSADHLDRHASFEDYARAKARIFRNQTESDWAVVNADDAGVMDLARASRGAASSRSARPSGATSPAADAR